MDGWVMDAAATGMSRGWCRGWVWETALCEELEEEDGSHGRSIGRSSLAQLLAASIEPAPIPGCSAISGE